MSRCDDCKKKFTCKRSKYYNGDRESDSENKKPASNTGFISITLLLLSPLKYKEMK